MVTWIRDPRVKAGDPELARTLPLAGCLDRAFACDAHMQAAVSPLNARLSSKHLGTAPITMTILCFDLDGPNHVATAEWRADTEQRIARLRTDQPDLRDYPTRGGHRVLWPLAEPFQLTSRDDAREWTRRYLEACDSLERDYGLLADRRCADPFRLFRLPHVERPQESSNPAQGAQAKRGVPSPNPTPGGMTKPIPAEDLEAARGLWGSDLGRAFDLLVARGLAYAELREPSEQGARRFAVRCPFEAQHKSGFSERDCILIGARHVGGDGWVACSHASCADRSQSEFLAALKASPLRGDAPERCAPILEGLPAEPTDQQLCALRVDGRDEFSTMKVSELRARYGVDELRGHAYELPALRWCARGLSPELTVRWANAMQAAYPR